MTAPTVIAEFEQRAEGLVWRYSVPTEYVEARGYVAGMVRASFSAALEYLELYWQMNRDEAAGALAAAKAEAMGPAAALADCIAQIEYMHSQISPRKRAFVRPSVEACLDVARHELAKLMKGGKP